MVLSMDTLKAFSANLNFHVGPGQAPGITFPLVQGMGFVSGIYKGLKPLIQSSVLFRSFQRISPSPQPGMAKYKIVLEDGRTVNQPLWFSRT